MLRVRGRGTRSSEEHSGREESNFYSFKSVSRCRTSGSGGPADASAAFAHQTLRNLLRLNNRRGGNGNSDSTALSRFNRSRLLSSDGEPVLPTALGNSCHYCSGFCISSRRWFYSQGDIDNSLKVLDDLKFNSP